MSPVEFRSDPSSLFARSSSPLRPRSLSPSLPFSAPLFSPPRVLIYLRVTSRDVPLDFPSPPRPASFSSRNFSPKGEAVAVVFVPRELPFPRDSRARGAFSVPSKFQRATCLPPHVRDKLAATIKINRSRAISSFCLFFFFLPLHELPDVITASPEDGDVSRRDSGDGFPKPIAAFIREISGISF